ncbi:MAG TPA: transglutaminase family protein [Aquabacterium sp.]|nr:transglutaminase family protein [Aquabacterium sp.]
MHRYLQPSEHIDFLDPIIQAEAQRLSDPASSRLELIRRTFEFVRDEIKHSSDFKLNPVTCRASDVLRHKTGYCYAKAHLLAALLRANGIPTGLCYQRLSLSGSGAPFCLHGLNAVHIDGLGWYRVDARGNKQGVDAQFSPPREQLAFPVLASQERDLPEIWAEPLPAIVEVLTRYQTYDQVYAHLPDVDLFN